MTLDQTRDQTEAVRADVQQASEQLAVVGAVLEQNLPTDAQVGDVAQALDQTSHLEKKMAQSAQALTEVSAALEQEIGKRAEITEQLHEAQALVDKLSTEQRETND